MLELIFYGLVAGLFSLVGGLLIIWKPRFITPHVTSLVSFAAGAFLGVSFLDILPEALEAVEESHPVLQAFLVGFVIFFALERVLMRVTHGHRHEEEGKHEAHTETLPPLLILGDSLHNFLDGVVIALAWMANPALGLITALGIAAHEIPQEIGDFAILLDRGWSKVKIIAANVLSSLCSVAGAIVGYFASGFFAGQLSFLLAAVAGIFTYIAASDLIPEIHHRAGHERTYGVLLPFLAGLLLIGYLVSLSHAG
ncbi:MAG: ZIP family metal transporter [Candidatus Liptonbacteria bacterium]|nr:ZIP family metal transporter [Candidatus Liptonbacteria bacterium]